jgi:hypothetical protein
MPRPSHHSWLDHSNYTWRRVQVMNEALLSKFSKAANLFEISTRYRSLLSTSLNFLTLNLSMWNLCCLFTHCQPFPNLCHHQYHNLLAWMIGHQVYLNVVSCQSKCGQFDCAFSHQETSKPILNVRNGEELLAPCPTPKLEDHPLSAARNCLFSIFTAALHNWRASPPSTPWGRAMQWWQGTHLTWSETRTSNHYEVSLPFLVQSSLNLRTQL